MVRDLVVGIDLGGTNVRAGAIDRGGRILCPASLPIEAARGPEAGVARIAGLVAQVVAGVDDGRLAAIGIGATGPIDRMRGAICNPYTLPTWEDVDIVGPLAARFGVPVAFENDADAAGLGEYWLGAGQGATRLYMLTIGTGVGSAFVLDGQVYRGLQGVHPEAGHMVIEPSGPECYCGARGCIESLIAGPAIARNARAWAQDSTLPEDARRLVELARAGHPGAATVVARAANYLALATLNIILLLTPETIVYGGGVMQNFDLFAPTLHATLARHTAMVPAADVRLAPARLGDNAGVAGAGYAAWCVAGSKPIAEESTE
jgi:glucokinase